VLKKDTTKKEAWQHLREIERQVDRGLWMPTKNIPIFSKVAKEWLKYKKPNLRSSTWSAYEGHTQNHFKDLDQLKLNRITVSTIEKYITDRQNEGMHILTLRKILVSLGQILSYAVRHRYLDHNPLKEAERPKGHGKVKSKKIRVLPPTEINDLINAVSDQKYKTLFRLAIMSGARQGELLGLKWSDIDWENSQIHIHRTFNCQCWFDVKTETSNRKINIGPEMMIELKKWEIACPPTKLNLVFPNGAGNTINHNNMVNRHFDPALKKAKIGKVRFHDMRHTYASLLIEQGENIKYIQSQLGHSSPTVTLNVYALLMKPVNQEAACRLETSIFKVNRDQMETDEEKQVSVVLFKRLSDRHL